MPNIWTSFRSQKCLRTVHGRSIESKQIVLSASDWKELEQIVRTKLLSHAQFSYPHEVPIQAIVALFSPGDINMLTEVNHYDNQDIYLWSIGQNGKTSAYPTQWRNLAKRIGKMLELVEFR
jgi:hypothetical protein